MLPNITNGYINNQAFSLNLSRLENKENQNEQIKPNFYHEDTEKERVKSKTNRKPYLFHGWINIYSFVFFLLTSFANLFFFHNIYDSTKVMCIYIYIY